VQHSKCNAKHTMVALWVGLPLHKIICKNSMKHKFNGGHHLGKRNTQSLTGAHMEVSTFCHKHELVSAENMHRTAAEVHARQCLMCSESFCHHQHSAQLSNFGNQMPQTSFCSCPDIVIDSNISIVGANCSQQQPDTVLKETSKDT